MNEKIVNTLKNYLLANKIYIDNIVSVSEDPINEDSNKISIDVFTNLTKQEEKRELGLFLGGLENTLKEKYHKPVVIHQIYKDKNQ